MRRKQDFPARASDLPPAPGDLRLLQTFVNTADREHGTDELENPQGLINWLERSAVRIDEVEVGAAELERATEVREALRALLLTNNGGDVSQQTVARLDRAAIRSPVFVRFDDGAKTRFSPGGGLDGALGWLFAIVAIARADGSWLRMKVCANPECRAAFYDGSTNRGGRWCSMRRCGTRLHAGRYQRRQARLKNS